MNFAKWCTTDRVSVKGHDLQVLTAVDSKLNVGRDAVAAVVPGHYASEQRVADILKRLGKAKAAEYIQQKLPKSKSIRSGDLGEILGASYVAEFMPYDIAVNKLRWKDHREMAMRGEDIIGVRFEPKSKRLEFLKGEIKSRATLTTTVLSEARAALRKDNNRPSPHGLSYIADRLFELGKTDAVNAIDDAQFKNGIKLSQIEHLVFAFSGNDPLQLLKSNLLAYKGKVRQSAVGLWIATHQAFIKAVYEKVT